MGVNFENNIFKLETNNTSYQIMVDRNNFLLHLYYGKKVQGDGSYLLTYYDRGFSGNPYECRNNRDISMDALPMEYPCYGNGDFRTPAINIMDEEGIYGCDLRFSSYEIISGKYKILKLPAVYSDSKDAQTLKIILKDNRTQIEVILVYGILPKEDVITRSVIIRNKGKKNVKVTKLFSSSIDFVTGEYDLIHFHGRHGMERVYERTQIMTGKNSIGSQRGTSSHQHNPFVILAERNTTEDVGDCYGFSYLFSGNFTCEVEKDQFKQTRIGMGMQADMLEIEVKPEEEFYAPEVALVFSDEGLAGLSHRIHHMIRYNVCRGIYKTKRRPILINNWEATYFDFTGEKIIEIAKQAAELGVEMLVLDDGWFGNRNSDNAGLGDWVVNEEKMGAPLSQIVKKINELGMKFGLWIEPEMVNEDSDLFRKHPDWALRIPDKAPIMGRNQLVLDFSRQEVVDGIFEQIIKVIDKLNLAYIKMDMNRSITDVYTLTDGYQNQGQIMYNYCLGVYDFIERILNRYPDLLIEGCSGGGGRFDAGMLYYTPQIWCSDNTDAIERIIIQHGTSYGYPVSTVGSHVSAVPNHQTGRITNINTRAVVAMAGSFGYELDLSKISEEEKEEVKKQIRDYKKYWNVIHNGNYYRINNPIENKEVAAWEFVSKDKDEVLLNIVTLDTHCNSPVSYVRCKGLDADALYVLENEDGYYKKGTLYSGSLLMQVGIPVPIMSNEYQALQMHFVVNK